MNDDNTTTKTVLPTTDETDETDVKAAGQDQKTLDLNKKYVLVIFGLPGSGKTTIANLIAKNLGVGRINADSVRSSLTAHLGFSIEDRIKQAETLGQLCKMAVSGYNQGVVVDFVNPTLETRAAFARQVGPDISVLALWMDTIKTSRYPDTDLMFVSPSTGETNYTLSEYLDEEAMHESADQVSAAVTIAVFGSPAKNYIIAPNPKVGQTVEEGEGEVGSIHKPFFLMDRDSNLVKDVDGYVLHRIDAKNYEPTEELNINNGFEVYARGYFVQDGQSLVIHLVS